MALSQGVQLDNRKTLLPNSYKKSILYHDVFDFPLTKSELLFWQVGENIKDIKTSSLKFISKKGFYFVSGREKSVIKRVLREEESKKKIKIAKKAAQILSQIPTVQMVGLTGSLAMMNASADSDIDLMIVTSKGTLWTTRVIVYIALALNGFLLRRAGESSEKNRLCLNIWLDKEDLKWKKKNIFTAHEVLQVKSLKNKNLTHEKFISENVWVGDFWPNAYKSMSVVKKISEVKFIDKIIESLFRLIEPLAFFFEYYYMRRKITKETITPTRALFHPFDWSRVVNSKIKPL